MKPSRTPSTELRWAWERNMSKGRVLSMIGTIDYLLTLPAITCGEAQNLRRARAFLRIVEVDWDARNVTSKREFTFEANKHAR